MTVISRIAAATSLAVLLLSATAFAADAASDGVPKLDVSQTCRPLGTDAFAMQIDPARCLKSEDQARQQLVREWAGFPASDRSLCTKTATLTSMASYVDLITCLEMRRDVTKLPADRGLTTAPAGMITR